MTAPSKIFERAQLAEASYSLFDRIDFTDSDQVRRVLDVANRSTLDGEFSAVQATEFVKNWRVVNHTGRAGEALVIRLTSRGPTSRG